MGELLCVDGSILSVVPTPVRDAAGEPYEITLRLVRDSAPFALVGERCGHHLRRLARQLGAARRDPGQAASWPDPDDRFPAPGERFAGPQPAESFRPGDVEYFSLRSRERGDLAGAGELRCLVRSSAHWTGHRNGSQDRGGWRLTRRAVIEAWGAGGTGVRSVLTSAELVAFLDTVLKEPDVVGATGSPLADAEEAMTRPGGMSLPMRRRRGRVPDGTTRPRLPALRAKARSIALTAGDPQACRGDVRW